MTERVAILLTLLAISVARPLQVKIDGMTLPVPSLRRASFSQLAVLQPGAAPAGAVAAAPAVAPVASVMSLGSQCGCAEVPANNCTCGATLNFLKCIALRCASGACACPMAPFEQECTDVASTCGSELAIGGCMSSTTTCEGKFHQAAYGVIGFTLDLKGLTEEAYCGPYGRCTGEVRLLANVYRMTPGVWFECLLPMSVPSRVAHCSSEVTAEGMGECVLPMLPYLNPADTARGHCYLTQGKHGMRISKASWFLVRNRYDASHLKAALEPSNKVVVKSVELRRAPDSVSESAAEVFETEHDEDVEEGALLKEAFQGTGDRELPMPKAPVVDKFVLAVINLLGWGLCGLDRCYLGQYTLGTIKFLTLGGCGLWCLVDYVVIVFNCLMQYESMDVVGFNARFRSDTIWPALLLTAFIVVLKVVLSVLQKSKIKTFVHKRISKSAEQTQD